ncbi:MAG: DUF192 domain-containing protein [Ignavibacteriaceae bacterium]|nr:DUF192 domain-containing protein [Ignavibacteriaceae bacterium]
MSKQAENNTSVKLKNQRPFFSNQVYIIAGVVILAVILYLIINPFSTKESTDTEYMFKKDGELTFTDSLNNFKTKIDIQIANSDFDRELGLMFRKQMDENRGMLFIFPTEERQSFWMRNTFISLDMLFVNASNKIVTIHRNTQTLSDQSYPSTAPAKYVIEVNGGYCSKHNINEGDKINFKELTQK